MAEERRDYVAYCSCGCGAWFACMCETTASSDDVRRFYKENAGLEIRIVPVAKMVFADHRSCKRTGGKA